MAEFIGALRRIDPAGAPPAGRSGPLAPRDPATRSAIESVRGMVDTDAVTAAWDAALQIPEWDGAPVWLHTDLAAGNVLLADGRLSAVIDWAGMGVGDPACDLPVAWNLLPTAVRDVFRATLEVDDATWARGHGWALSIALIQLPAMDPERERRSSVLLLARSGSPSAEPRTALTCGARVRLSSPTALGLSNGGDENTRGRGARQRYEIATADRG